MRFPSLRSLGCAALGLLFAASVSGNVFESCTSETKLQDSTYIGACGYEQSDTFALSSSSYVTWVRIWYDTAKSPSGISATITGPNNFTMSQATTKGGCYAGWCEGKFIINNTLAAGNYTVTSSASSVCRDPSGVSTIVVYGCAGASSSSNTGSNLLVNGDAESVPAASSGVTSFPGWSSDGYVTILQYGVGDYIGASATGPSNRGNNFFYGGSVSASSASQSVSLSFASTSIDAGSATYTLSGWLGGWSGQDDNVVVSLGFFDANQRQLGTSTSIGPVKAADRNSVTALLERASSGTVPSGARSAKVTVAFNRTSGTSNDGYADNLSLVINQSGGPTTPTTPTTPTNPTTLTGRADCVFGWGESAYPELFSPSGATSKTLGPYYYRYFSKTNSYLGINTSDEHLVYVGLLSGNSLLDLGALSGWLGRAGCQ